MWRPSELYFTLKRPLTMLGPPQVVGSPTATLSPLVRSISGASWNEAESIPSVSGMGFGDLTTGYGVGAFRSKFSVALGLLSLITRFVIGAAARPWANAATR